MFLCCIAIERGKVAQAVTSRLKCKQSYSSHERCCEVPEIVIALVLSGLWREMLRLERDRGDKRLHAATSDSTLLLVPLLLRCYHQEVNLILSR